MAPPMTKARMVKTNDTHVSTSSYNVEETRSRRSSRHRTPSSSVSSHTGSVASTRPPHLSLPYLSMQADIGALSSAQTPVTKRGPGRPRKNQSLQANHIVASAPVPKQRGPPPFPIMTSSGSASTSRFIDSGPGLTVRETIKRRRLNDSDAVVDRGLLSSPPSLFTPPSSRNVRHEGVSPSVSDIGPRYGSLHEQSSAGFDILPELKYPDTQKSTHVPPAEDLDDSEEALRDMLEVLTEQSMQVEKDLQTCKDQLALARARSRPLSEDAVLDLTKEPEISDDHEVSHPQREQTSTIISKLTKENQKLKNQLLQQHGEMQELTTLQESRAQELHGYQSFLSKADEFSVSECIQAVRALNAEIEQSCASIADTATDNPKTHTASAEDMNDRERFIRDHTRNGEVLASWIDSNRSQEDPTTLLQFCLQQTLTVMFCDLLLEWSWQDGRRRNRIVENIYLAMQQTESQSVAGRWRTLTRSQTKPKDEKAFERMRNNMFSWIETFIVVHGWSLDAENLRSLIDVRIKTFQRHVVEIELMLNQGLRTVDLRPFCADPGIAFDATFMEDAEEGAKKPPKGARIAFSTGMGVQMYNADTKEHSVLLKTKVQLLSTIHAILEDG